LGCRSKTPGRQPVSTLYFVRPLTHITAADTFFQHHSVGESRKLFGCCRQVTLLAAGRWLLAAGWAWGCCDEFDKMWVEETLAALVLVPLRENLSKTGLIMPLSLLLCSRQ